jgi:RNA polymerase sigma-70 factor (ECF subfamily)
MHRMLHAEWIDHARHRATAREESMAGELPAVSPGDAADAIDVRRALAALPERQREVVVLHVFIGFSFREIAQIAGVSTFTTASRYRLAIDRLRVLLGE